MLSALADAGISSSSVAGLREMLFSMPDPFKGLDSAHIHETFYKEHFSYLVSS